jgi:hypothetical protein
VERDLILNLEEAEMQEGIAHLKEIMVVVIVFHTALVQLEAVEAEPIKPVATIQMVSVVMVQLILYQVLQ